MSAASVLRYRRAHGVEPWVRPSAVEPFEHLLGTVPDAVIAAKAGVAEQTVWAYRHKLQIPSMRESGDGLEHLHRALRGEPGDDA